MNSRRSIFTFAAGRRSKWVVFAIWLVGIFIAAGPANLPGKFEDAESNESTSYLPGDAESTQGADRDRGPAGRRARAGGDRLPARAGLTPADRQDREDVEKMTTKRFPGVVRRRRDGGGGRQGGRRLRGPGAEGGQAPTGQGQGGLPAGCGGPTTDDPRPARRLRALRRPGLLAGRQGGDRHRLHQGQRRGRTDPRPGQVLARHDLRPGRRPRGQDHRRRRLLRRRDRSLRRHQRHAAAGRGQRW